MNPYQPPNFSPPAAAPQGPSQGGQGYPSPLGPAGAGVPFVPQQGPAPQGYVPPAPQGYAPPAPPQGPPAGAGAAPRMYGQRAVTLFGAGAAKTGMDRLPRIPLGEHMLQFVSVEAETRRNDSNYIIVFDCLASNRPEVEKHKVIFYQSLVKQDVALGQIKGVCLPLLGYARNDPKFGETGDYGAIVWLDQAINEAIVKDPVTGKGIATYGGTWENWGTDGARLVTPGPSSFVGRIVRCVAEVNSDKQGNPVRKPDGKRDVFGDEYYNRSRFYPYDPNT